MRSAFAVLLAAILGSAPAHAGSPCPSSVGDGRAISLKDQDVDYFSGLQVSLWLGLTPSSFPFDQVAAEHDACQRGDFDAAGETFTGHGSDGGAPPRWAIGSNPQKIVYLALIPPPSEALEWAKKRNANDNSNPSFSGSPLYVLAVTSGDVRNIFAIFETIPGDDKLKSSFRDALEGRIPRLATFDERTGQTTFEAR